ncbi:elongation of very long chain fatty acids protein AAEL008004-like isoform X1 [Hylaeus anthracinus]|uniref:elongation of very long chain fatty acids protein AAEL008004-like isoform X1 n=1 Tax=Hylaeus anthracinus TaxID=313031 RepID=UPI0023B9840D|nr:elongation of very long chain fatty acids protein AAEL008004-like isoform X1 [Hylaeus anthracinus]XP_054001059.1 elongation of very long chain fatty acids protein AAEL008004-like isoform X1 [Hylaeus anthracinus]XP_054001060.1 elongation of very long chain fatty acids protein AAEL008004-like isoform X1 [Hylaeus anthracinus]
MSIVMHYVDRLHEILDKHADQRTTNWFMMSSPFPTLFICLTYVYVVKVLGPKLMENRKPFQLNNILVMYNLFQMVFSAWLFYELGMSGWLTGDYSLRCQPVDYNDQPKVLRMVHACWWYYFSKFTEFMDTIFFVLRKKNNHVSTLHVIHHGCMPMSVWFGVKFTPGGHSTFFGLLNTFVHIVMYTYYMLAAMGPKVQPYLWWKKYLTVFQMVQFVLVMIHAFQLLFIECNYPKAFVWWIGLHATMFFFLFNEFYQQSYQSRKRPLANGVAKKDHQQSSQTNGLTNGSIGNSSSGRRDAADYYVKGDSLAASELNLRRPYTTTE